jgi:hypothetical protein
MRSLKAAARFGVLYVAAFLLVDGTIIVDRREYSQAVELYTRNPTPQNDTLVRSERRENEHTKAVDAALAASIVTAITFGVWAYRTVCRMT